MNSLTLMRKCHRDAEAKDVPVNLSMALEAVSVFLFWKDYDSVQAVFDSLERTDGAQNALQLANELLLVSIFILIQTLYLMNAVYCLYSRCWCRIASWTWPKWLSSWLV